MGGGLPGTLNIFSQDFSLKNKKCSEWPGKSSAKEEVQSSI